MNINNELARAMEYSVVEFADYKNNDANAPIPKKSVVTFDYRDPAIFAECICYLINRAPEKMFWVLANYSKTEPVSCDVIKEAVAIARIEAGKQ